jgi:hypothetical protein
MGNTMKFVITHQTNVKWWLDKHGMWTDSKKHARQFASKKEAALIARNTAMRAEERKLLQIKGTTR